ncbi:metallocarboxypeptidase A-like protein MCYG_01475, partial [Durio zibethinus]|uniref:Metallocarboxypeptidase A-like protein MCYG_01475 n=1 Tax=Durio zibethinus TaxID=66656 RepID=A0A6P5WPT2_DURZI
LTQKSLHSTNSVSIFLPIRLLVGASFLLLSSFLSFFACLRSFSLVCADANLTQPSFTPVNHHLYHSGNDLIEQIKSVVHRHPDKRIVETIKAGNKGYEAEITVVTYCQSGKESDDRSKFRILLSFRQHGRELITSELAWRILSILSEEQFLLKMDRASLSSTLENVVIKGVPMENLNGRKLVEAGELCERRNGRGVDLNRNWSVDWGKKEKDYDPYEENPGTAAFSEPETQIIQKLAISFDPQIWVNVHSGMEALFLPYDHKNTTPDGLPSRQMRLLLEELNKVHFHKRCMNGSGGGSVGYLTRGTATDYMYDVVRVPMAFTFEIYGDGTASTIGCFKMVNPVDHTTLKRVLNDWSAAFFTTFKLGPRQLDVHTKVGVFNLDKWVSIDEYLDTYLIGRRNRYGKKMELLEVGMQETRTYFRLFLLSSVLLFFMFCSRISKTKGGRLIVSAIPL